MTIDTKELRKLAEAVKALEDDTEREDEHAEAKGALWLYMHCHTILALLDEIEQSGLRIAAEQDRVISVIGQCAHIEGERDRLKAENESLRKIISDSATACGAAVSVECSLEFMAMLPGEIGLVVNRLKSQVATLQAEPNSYQSGFDAGRRSSAVYAQSHRNEALAVSAKNVELRAENEALRKDAERYRWLRDSEYAGKTLRDMGAKYREDADERIDAAMAKEAGHD